MPLHSNMIGLGNFKKRVKTYKEGGGKKATCCITHNYAGFDILSWFFYYHDFDQIPLRECRLKIVKWTLYIIQVQKSIFDALSMYFTHKC